MSDPQAKPVFLHVGLMKTGTSYIQTTLRASTEQLAGQGLTVVPGSQPASHQLALAVREMEGVRYGDPVERLPRQLANAAGDRALVTQEMLSFAEPAQIERLGRAIDTHELHLVVTVRDIARTIPSSWQQQIKSGRLHRYEDFVGAITSGRDNHGAGGFWRSQGVVDVLARWSAIVPDERVHVVIVPSPGAPQNLLLQRFCSVIDVDPEVLARDVARVNESLGMAQAEVLRQVNELVQGRFERVPYGDVFKRYFSRHVLVPQGGRRPLVPVEHRAWCDEHAQATIEKLAASGYDIVGDLEELRPPDSAFTDADQAVTDAEVASSAVKALATVLADRIEMGEAGERGDDAERPTDAVGPGGGAGKGGPGQGGGKGPGKGGPGKGDPGKGGPGQGGGQGQAGQTAPSAARSLAGKVKRRLQRLRSA